MFIAIFQNRQLIYMVLNSVHSGLGVTGRLRKDYLLLKDKELNFITTTIGFIKIIKKRIN